MFKCSGYMSPKYAMQGLFSEKSDVFSFGILLLEIVSGRRSTSFCNDEQYLSLIGYVSLSNLEHSYWEKFSQILLKMPLYLFYLVHVLHGQLPIRLNIPVFVSFRHGNCPMMTTVWLW